MKRPIICLGILLTAIVGGVRAYGATSLKPTEIRQNLLSTCFLNEHEGWIVGELGRIFHTTDGGKSFVRQNLGTRNAYTSISCFPDRRLFLVGPNGAALRSLDGGEKWETLKTGSPRNLLSASFPTPNLGVAVGDFGTILRTEDAGLTWTKIEVPAEIPLPEGIAETISPGDVLLYDVHFVDEMHGWIVGEFGVVFVTADGGLTWLAQKSPSEVTLFGVEFTDPLNGWAAGLESMLLHTVDGGVTWERKPTPANKGLLLSLYDVVAAGPVVWAYGDSGFLLYSADSGATWTQQKVSIDLAGGWLRGMSLVASGDGYIVGGDGLIMAVKGKEIRQLGK